MLLSQIECNFYSIIKPTRVSDFRNRFDSSVYGHRVGPTKCVVTLKTVTNMSLDGCVVFLRNEILGV